MPLRAVGQVREQTMRQIGKAWVAEARTLAGVSLSVTSTMFAQLAISAMETLTVARLGVHVLVGVTLALSVYGAVATCVEIG